MNCLNFDDKNKTNRTKTSLCEIFTKAITTKFRTLISNKGIKVLSQWTYKIQNTAIEMITFTGHGANFCYFLQALRFQSLWKILPTPAIPQISQA